MAALACLSSEASLFQSGEHGYFSLNWQNSRTIREAEINKPILMDLIDYQSGCFDDKMARKHGADSVEQRIIQLKTKLKGKIINPLVQRLHPVSNLSSVLDQLTERDDFNQTDFFVSQNIFQTGKSRQSVNLQSLSMLFVDIDIAKPVEDATDAQNRTSDYLKCLSPEKQADFVLYWMDSDGIPRPSYILHSGGGLHLKWLFDKAVPASAKPVWDKLEEYLIARLASLDLPVDAKVRDVSRVLRLAGSINQRHGIPCMPVWINSPTGELEDCHRYDFNDLADDGRILPFTRTEARAYKDEMRKKTAVWDANRLAAEARHAGAAKSFMDGLKKPSKAISEYLNKELCVNQRSNLTICQRPILTSRS